MSADATAKTVLEIQQQAREQATLAQQAFAELDSWASDIKQKDKTLKATSSAVKALPPVRGQRRPKAVAKAKTTAGEETAAEKKQRLRSADYRGWDKYDVDAEIQALDAAVQQETEDQASEDEEDMDADALREVKMRELMATQEKDKGNEQFKQGKYAAAITCYSRGLEVDPYNATLFANRAMARIKMKQFAEAEKDATATIELDNLYVKAWARRGTARAALGRCKEALADFKQVKKLDPKNALATVEIPKLTKRIALEEEQQFKSFNPLLAAAQHEPAVEEKPLRRIHIEEIGGSDDEADNVGDSGVLLPGGAKAPVGQPTAEAAAAKPNPVTELPASKPQITELAAAPVTTTATTTTATATASNPTAKKPAPTPTATAKKPTPTPTATAAKPTTTPTATATKPTPTTEEAPQPHRAASAKATQQVQASKQPAASQAAKKPAATGQSQTTQPSATAEVLKNSFHFEKAWRAAKGNHAALADLVKSLPPQKLGKLINQNLDAELLCDMVTVLARDFVPSNLAVMPLLAGLARVPRFDTTLMFLEEEELAKVKGLFDMLEASGADGGQPLDKTQLRALGKTYGVR